MHAIDIFGLTKRYRRLRGAPATALDSLDLVVERGGVFGFLGPNGSGKTTTIRCLLGLVHPDAGVIRVLGHDVRTEMHKIAARTGALVEAPAALPTFTGRRNLELLGAMADVSSRRIDEVLELVGLADRAQDLVKSYSLGMRQRLGIAAALIKDPELLVLDEPANGLDPAGMKEIRQLLQDIGGKGHTVFVSSHLLSEVQQICDRVAILSGGRCVASGAVDEVLSSNRRGRILVRVSDPVSAVAAISAAGAPAEVRDGYVTVDVDPARGAWVAEVLARSGIYPSELKPESTDLETVFLELTQQGVAAA